MQTSDGAGLEVGPEVGLEVESISGNFGSDEAESEESVMEVSDSLLIELAVASFGCGVVSDV